MEPKQTWEVLGEQFVVQYYRCFDSNQKENLISMYHATALLTYEDNKVQGHDSIKDILLNKVRFNTIQHVVTKCDCQPTSDNGVVIMVSGMLKTDDDPAHAYSEVFVIKPDVNNSYFIFHHLFRLSIHNM